MPIFLQPSVFAVFSPFHRRKHLKDYPSAYYQPAFRQAREKNSQFLFFYPKYASNQHKTLTFTTAPTEKKDATMKGKSLKPSRGTSNLPVQALFSYELIGFSSMIKYFCPEY